MSNLDDYSFEQVGYEAMLNRKPPPGKVKNLGKKQIASKDHHKAKRKTPIRFVPSSSIAVSQSGDSVSFSLTDNAAKLIEKLATDKLEELLDSTSFYAEIDPETGFVTVNSGYIYDVTKDGSFGHWQQRETLIPEGIIATGDSGLIYGKVPLLPSTDTDYVTGNFDGTVTIEGHLYNVSIDMSTHYTRVNDAGFPGGAESVFVYLNDHPTGDTTDYFYFQVCEVVKEGDTYTITRQHAVGGVVLPSYWTAGINDFTINLV